MLDEPLANLDIKYQIELVRLLKTLRDEKNISIIMALHDINMALRFSKVILVKDGSVLGIGRPEEVLSDTSLRNAFDIQVRVIRQSDGNSFIHYGDNA
jgi:iron complex transport system ATP-binding protein